MIGYNRKIYMIRTQLKISNFFSDVEIPIISETLNAT